MDPFTIHCSSCQSRIRVRNPSMIGQIANCPKCGSMIMVTAPQQVAVSQQILVDSGTGSVTDSVAVTKEALPPPDAGRLGDLHPLEQGFDQAFRSEGLPNAGALESVAFESLSPTNWMPEPTPPPQIDQAPSVPPPSNSRQIMLVAALGLCSVALACGVFFAFLRWYGQPKAAAANQNATDQSAANSMVAKSTTAHATGIDPALASANAAQRLDAASLPEADQRPPVALDAPPSNPSVELSPNPPASEPNQANAGGDSVAGDSVAGDNTAGRAPENPANVSDGDPAGIGAPPTAAAGGSNPVEPNGAPLGTLGSGLPSSGGASLSSQLAPDIDSTFAVPGSAENAEPVKEALPPGLQSFASIFDHSLVPALSDASVPLAAAPDAGDDQPATSDVSAAASPMSLTLPETLEQKQATKISGLWIQDRPLAEVLSALAVAGDIPLTVDLDGLSAAGVDLNQAFNFKSATPVTVQDVIAALARDYNLSFEAYEKKLFIVRGAASAVESRVPASLPIADLVDGAEQSAALSAALSELLPELRDGFQLSDGAAQADLEKVNRLLWFQVARVLETWRSARGIANADTAAVVPKSSRLPPWPAEAVHKLAQQPISQRLLPAPLAQGWHRLAGEAGMVCWVDWPSLISAQASPAQIGMAISNGRPLQELLQHDADKYQVVFAIEDEQTLWVTSAEMHRFQPRLYVLPMAGKSIEEWRKELEPLTPFNPDGSEALKVVAAPDGRFVFVRCCRPLLAEPRL